MPEPSVFPSREPGVSGDFWGSQEGCQGPFRHSGRNTEVVVYYYSFYKLTSLVSFKWVSVLNLFSRRYLVFVGLTVVTLSW